MRSADLAVVGGSFAGLACAGVAASRGLSTVVLDGKREPGERPHTTGLLVKEAADLLKPPADLVREISRIRLYAPGGAHVDLVSPGYSFFATDMPGLARWMAGRVRKAGACWIGNARVTGLARRGYRWRLAPLDLGARYVVGADGPRSVVARAAGLGVNRAFLVGVEAEYTGLAGVDPDCLHCFLDSGIAPGYLAWVVPGVRGFQVGLACRHPHRPDLRGLVDRLSRVFDFRGARETGRRGGLIPVGGPVRPLGAEGVVLAGDAAGLVSPLTAGGIHTALDSGRLAGEAVAERLLRDGPEPAGVLAGAVPRPRVKRLLRLVMDLRPPNAAWDALLGRPVFRALAATVFFHHRGLLTRAALREVAAILLRAA